jgi:hypothetical protein
VLYFFSSFTSFYLFICYFFLKLSRNIFNQSLAYFSSELELQWRLNWNSFVNFDLVTLIIFVILFALEILSDLSSQWVTLLLECWFSERHTCWVRTSLPLGIGVLFYSSNFLWIVSRENFSRSKWNVFRFACCNGKFVHVLEKWLIDRFSRLVVIK